ncbi:hypothetical protein [uncultured Desulfosarcina sp.]|uniref:hypothetical protein n=1 Tax=uncultured Desulfosarcina sp. TaxID=218289 RepID=UPI0029C93D04|nr:hypothetical protein [uncultured Desulfosarcina sp.]
MPNNLIICHPIDLSDRHHLFQTTNSKITQERFLAAPVAFNLHSINSSTTNLPFIWLALHSSDGLAGKNQGFFQRRAIFIPHKKSLFRLQIDRIPINYRETPYRWFWLMQTTFEKDPSQ